MEGSEQPADLLALAIDVACLCPNTLQPSGMAVLNSSPLAGRRVVILGGSGAMGLAAATELEVLGAELVVVGRDASRLRQAAATLSSSHDTVATDASDPASLTDILESHAPVSDIVVAISNSGGGSGTADTGPDQAQRAFTRLWTGYTALHLAPRFLPDFGSVTLISGSSARTPLRGYGLWTTLHGSIEALSLAASIDIAPIRVNTISPGGIGMEPDRQLVERRGEASDIGMAVAMVIANPAMTGAVIDVDSGERKGSWPSETAVR